MPARKATASGKWSQSIWDVTPSVGDDVFANNFTVEIDQNVNIGSLRTTLSSGYAVAGGGFTLYQPLSVIASPGGFIPSTNISCITTYVSSGTAFLSGDMISSTIAGTNSVVTGVLEHNGLGKIELYGNSIGVTTPGTWRTGVLNKSSGQITIFGTVSGSSGQNNYGAYNTADGTIEVYGNVLAGAASANRADGIWNNATGLVKVFGNVTGTNAASNGMPGITNNSIGTVIVNGNVSAGTIGSGIAQNSTGTLLISGTITASANAHGVVSSSTAARNEFTGTLVNGDAGRQAVYCARYLVHPKMFDSATQHKNTEVGNVVPYSEQLDNAAWIKTATTVTANLTTSPFGALVADRVLETAASGLHYCYSTLSNISYTTPHTFSVYIKSNGRRYITLTNDAGGSTTNAYSAIYDLTNVTVLTSKNTGTGTISASNIQFVGNDWYRCSIGGSFTTGSGVFYPVIAISDRPDYSGTLVQNHYASYTGNALSGIYAYGAQFEYGTTPTAYLSSTDSVIYKNASVQPVTFYAPEAYSSSYVPHISSVALGTAYAAVSSLSGVAVNIPVQLSGTMVVPSEASVSFGTLVGQTTGTAVNTSAVLQQVWNTNINTLTAANSLGSRLKNAATVQEVGQQIQNLNL